MTWEQDGFAYADGYDEKAGRYQALRAGQQLLSLDPDGPGLIVKPELARRQMDEEAAKPKPEPPDGSAAGPGEKPQEEEKTPAQIRRFRGCVVLDPVRAGRHAGKIADEVIAHLSSLPNADVTVTLEIEAELPEGVPDRTVRTVTENSRTLKFEVQGFERE